MEARHAALSDAMSRGKADGTDIAESALADLL